MRIPRKVIGISILVILAVLLFSCVSSGLKRPYGYVRLGKLNDLLQFESFLELERILVRYDQAGFSAMSTLCTYDLSPLIKVDPVDAVTKVAWKSRYSTSTYSSSGEVISGPAKNPLPYYELSIDAEVINGPKDTLYVYIGKEKPKDWRLPYKPN